MNPEATTPHDTESERKPTGFTLNIEMVAWEAKKQQREHGLFKISHRKNSILQVLPVRHLWTGGRSRRRLKSLATLCHYWMSYAWWCSFLTSAGFVCLLCDWGLNITSFTSFTSHPILYHPITSIPFHSIKFGYMPLYSTTLSLHSMSFHCIKIYTSCIISKISALFCTQLQELRYSRRACITL